MEIERKFLVGKLPFDVKEYPCRRLSQGYISTDPVIRIREYDESSYELTCKGRGLMSREEINLPISREAYEHLSGKVEGRVIKKIRYLIPLENDLTCELDVFEGDLSPLVLAEVEFDSEEAAGAFTPPLWFGREVTADPAYQNSALSSQSSPA